MDAVTVDDKVFEFAEEGDEATLTELEGVGGGGCSGLLLPGPPGVPPLPGPPVGVVTPPAPVSPEATVGGGGPDTTRFIGLGFMRAAIGLSCEKEKKTDS